MTPRTEHAFDLRVGIGPAVEVGPVPLGRRRVIPITGGSVGGPKLSGTILAGGADWQLIRPDGVAEIDARYTLRADDGTLIGVTNKGVRHGPDDVMKRLAAGEAVDPAAYYFRTTPVFEAAAGKHDWLNRAVFVASGERHPGHVLIRVWQVL